MVTTTPAPPRPPIVTGAFVLRVWWRLTGDRLPRPEPDRHPRLRFLSG
ncbi:hypothetical protein [Nonomuraea aurantiaca]|jgi:hypothetical protein|nr:hypothetical protein [Nonomuraea aurantiaca]MCA2230247.1 hypothetical protein [Nonomuraea aurantiaca]